jgi:hypothetical protein
VQFELFRLSLLERGQRDLFAVFDGNSNPPRELWLRRIFSEKIAFQHRGDTFHYVPEPDVPDSPESVLILGRIGRQLSVRENEPPESGLHETVREAWRAARVFIDPTTHDDGQKVAIEDDSHIGKPKALLESLVEHINARVPAERYYMEVAGIVDPATFWDFVNANLGDVTVVEFDFVAPNMFGGEEFLDKELREMRNVENVRRTKVKLENSDGLKLNTDRIATGVTYATRGGGAVKAQTRQRKRYNSASKIKRVSVPEAELTESIVQLVRLIIDRAFTRR